MTEPGGEIDRDVLRHGLLAWYGANRRELPWRAPPQTARAVREAGPAPGSAGDATKQQPDPYRIWIAEVMLTQTQVGTVVPYYERFLARFPDVHVLAAADLDEVLKVWEGLGYYARARNLHAAARTVVGEHGGRLPRDLEDLRSLPGIGPYTAAAIRAIAFGAPELAVDGNVRRVLSRVFDLPQPSRAEIIAVAGRLVEERPGDVNQALMDLGSTICTPRSPRCEICPLEDRCLARVRNTVSLRPGRRPQRERPHYDVAVGVIWIDGELLIAKRRPEGLLGGLWEFPGGKPVAGETLEQALEREIREELDIEVDVGAAIASVDHAYSHFRVTLHAFHCQYRSGTPRARGCADLARVRPQDLDDYAFPAANRRILARLEDHKGQSSATPCANP